jgi:hypothetical protein
MDRNAVLDVIYYKVSFLLSKALTTLFYAMDMEQCSQYIRLYAWSYIDSCLTKLGWAATTSDTPLMVPLNFINDSSHVVGEYSSPFTSQQSTTEYAASMQL